MTAPGLGDNTAARAKMGSKLWILRLGKTEGDAAWFIQGANNSTVSEPRPEHQRLTVNMMAALVEHPDGGLFLYDVGSAPDPVNQWGPEFCDAFPWIEYGDESRLDHAVEATGHRLEEVSGVIISHLHLDHAGGLEFFRSMDVPVYVHRDELEYAFYAVATKVDGNYQSHYLDPSFNWQVIEGDELELASGLTVHHTPGHTPGLMGLLLDLSDTGPQYFASDQFIFKENLLDSRPLGWLMGDADAWTRSSRKIKRLVERTGATVIFGHDGITLERLAPAPEFHQ